MTQVLISAGSNEGDKYNYLAKAIEQIKIRGLLSGIVVSYFYQTEPVGVKDQNEFLNCAILGQSNLDAEELLFELKNIENTLGRISRPLWHEREIDLDIIFFGDEVIENKNLIIPHPRMQERNFVLFPSLEIAPDMIHPISKKSILELAAECEDRSDFNILVGEELSNVI
jgi:2-amino-4-hydroxy-6-hydroxymethyldihydropteridine diphosphokinase